MSGCDETITTQISPSIALSAMVVAHLVSEPRMIPIVAASSTRQADTVVMTLARRARPNHHRSRPQVHDGYA
jgi:hypothetical protein